MSDLLRKNAITIFNGIPSYIYWVLLLLFCLGTLLLCSTLRLKKGLTWSIILLFIEYYFLILSSTILFRPITSWEHNFSPFWSYGLILKGEKELIADNLLNIIVFVPIGILLGKILNKAAWWQIIIIGIVLSLNIESLQYIFNRGFSEFDDVMHNTLGCMIGYLSFYMISKKQIKFKSLRNK